MVSKKRSLSQFYDRKIYENDPFAKLDQTGVGKLVKMAADLGRSTRPDIKLGICGEHGGDPSSVEFCHKVGLTYVSCSPFRVPIARLAAAQAAINVQKAHADWSVKPEIMIPLSCDAKELAYVKKVVVATADAEIAAAGSDLKYEVGTMIEIPRACLTADEIIKEAEFFCFGTNDLTQMTFGFSRDDAGKFLTAYYESKIYENDPFARIDQNGVGKLMSMAVDMGKEVRPNMHIGICGEHGGDPTSVEFCHKIGLSYVSCSPFRVPIARLAAAQAAIAEMK